jgi:hypothetical protein
VAAGRLDDDTEGNHSFTFEEYRVVCRKAMESDSICKVCSYSLGQRLTGCNSAQSKADQQGERAYPKHIYATADYDVEGQDKGSAWDAWESLQHSKAE